MTKEEFLNLLNLGYSINVRNITFIKWEKDKAEIHFNSGKLIVTGPIIELKKYFDYIDEEAN